MAPGSTTGADGPTLRVTARVLPVDPRGRVLLLQDQDPARPGVLRWGTIGGAVDPGESLLGAAVREMHEETGITISSEQLIGPVHRDVVPFSYDGRAFLGDSTFYALPLDQDVEVVFDHLEPVEVDNVVDHGWWTPDALTEDGTAVLPDLPAIMAMAIDAVAGRTTATQDRSTQ